MEHKLSYYKESKCFEEALLLGNGSLGATVYGRCHRERISLNHDTLWSGKPRTIRNEKATDAFRESQRLVLEDEIPQAVDLLEREFTDTWSNSYLPLGNLYIDFPDGEVSDYSRELDMSQGVVSVGYTQDGVRFEREYFVSHPDNCLVIHVKTDAPAGFSVSADSQLKSAVTAEPHTVCLTVECPTSISPSYARGSVPTVYDGDGIRCAAIAKVVTNGQCRFDEQAVHVHSATESTIVLCVETSYIDFQTLPTKPYYYPCLQRAEAISQKDYSLLLADHIADHSALYNRVKLDLGLRTPSGATDSRIKGIDSDLGMVELLYNFGRYLIIASSREGSQATNLQGIWNEELFAPWSSNYTVNINTEMNYWPVLMNNLAGLDLPVCDLVQKISITGADVAKEFYGVGGYCAHHNIDLWGHASPVGNKGSGCLSYAFWNLGSGWLCRHLWDHYEYTLDEAFLRDTAYPLFKGAVEFYLALLIRDGDRYILTPTTSPENWYVHPRHGGTGLAKIATTTQATLMDLFGITSSAAKILGIEDEFIKQVREILPRLNTYKIGSEGQLLEFGEDFEEGDIHHRHNSHLYGLYPGESITTESTPELAEACRQTLERRGDYSTGWAMGWRVCLWAKLKDGDRALKLIKHQLSLIVPDGKTNYQSGGTYPNLMDAHPPFQIDGNFGVCAGITLMLLQCEDHKIRLLPALPRELQNGSIRGLKAKGDITVDMVWQDGKLTEYTLLSPVDCNVLVATPEEERRIALGGGVKKQICV